MTDRLMIDIETLGTEPGCAIASIGAVWFDEHGVVDGPGTDAQFYKSVDIETCTEVGLTIDADTLKWWLDQPDVTRKQLKGGEPLETVLSAFIRFAPRPDEVWANSPKFDCGILEAAFEAEYMEAPWDFYDLRDYRTLMDLPSAQSASVDGVEHHALDDARQQAESVAATLREMRGGGHE